MAAIFELDPTLRSHGVVRAETAPLWCGCSVNNAARATPVCRMAAHWRGYWLGIKQVRRVGLGQRGSDAVEASVDAPTALTESEQSVQLAASRALSRDCSIVAP